MPEEIIDAVETAIPETEEKNEGLSWADFPDDDDTNTDLPDNNVVQEDKEVKEKEWWETGKEKTKIEAESEEDFVKKVTTPKEVFISDKDKDIKEWRSHLSKEDKDLVEAELKATGDWDKKEIEEYVAKLEKNGDLKFKAKEIRAGLNRAITLRQTEINKKESEKEEYRKNFATTLNQNVTNVLSKTDTVLGFKVGMNETDVKKWQESTSKYITSGKVTQDIDAILKEAHEGKPERFIELVQFLRKKDGIKKGLMQIGEQKGSNSILAELENTDTSERSSGERNAGEKKAPGWFTDPTLRKQAGLTD